MTITTNSEGLTQFNEPFTFDSVLRILNKVPFSTPFIALLPALAVLYNKHKNPSLVLPNTATDALPLIRSLLFSQYKWVGFIWIFILIRTINRGLNRYTRNHKEWRRDPIDYNKDVVVITGGSQGIGKEIVQLLSHKHKAHIAVLDMAPPGYMAAPAGAPEILYYKTDVSNREQVAEVGKKIREATGGKKVGVLINCAGVASGNTILDVDLDSAARLWRINTFANWITAKEFIPDMIARNHGHVITVSSAGAYSTLPSMSEYATSKAAALAFHECLAIELRTRYNAPRVRTTLVAPTKVRTALGDGMEDHADPFFTPVLEPIQVARKVVWSLDSGLSQHLMLPGFANLLPWIRCAPDWFRRLLAVLDNGDNTVTHKSMSRAMKNGYGSNWEGADKELYERRAKLMAATNGTSK
ncbi:related to retinal short-chain dehydrogenase/reductase [Melanopsichium pennsylvanicum]|uniref:Short-chain dehydrogenase/reductase 3 n=2 Tax=Melanopsichium pennsylvanicum TaxID=63383 RepID=A0AAJ5C5U1_9BASI|nr:related to retinal short-chain dehydrogenase/reductase [Melanopsichium pennsylvanicum 4]SNX85110.1 related to retinal short-chain dehydrogenase/reductase [Melanopsichium pennsylvanicum]